MTPGDRAKDGEKMREKDRGRETKDFAGESPECGIQTSGAGRQWKGREDKNKRYTRAPRGILGIGVLSSLTSG